MMHKTTNLIKGEYMENYNEIKDTQLEDFLSIMEHPEEWSEEDIRELMDNEEFMQYCQSILDCRVAMHQENVSRLPDVEREWKNFSRKHSRHSKFYWITLGATIGVAATLLLLFAFPWITGYQNLSKETIVHFTAEDEPVKEITLQTSSGVQFCLNDASCNDQLSHLGAELIKTDSARLEYSASVDQVEHHLLTTPRGKTFEVVLADGSKIWLNADSRLEYPSRFVGAKRVVKLYGEAYFQVAKNESQPFIVETDGLQTMVLGTEFNVRSYKDSPSHVTLIEGSVKVSDIDNKYCVMLKPSENVRLLDDGTFSLQKVDVDKYIYWRDGFFYFDNMSFADIMQDIGRWYNVNVIFENPKAMGYKLRYFCKRDEGIEIAIERLKCMKKARITLENNTVYIR